MAVWSLVLSAIPVPVLWLVSVGLGVAVFVRSKDGRDHGKTFVAVGFSLIGAWLLVFAAIAAFAVLVEMQPEQQENVRGDVWIEDVRIGDCLARDLDEEVTLVKLVPCAERHRLETYAIFDLPAGPFPGLDDVDRLAEGGCTQRFEEFVGLSYDDSEFDYQSVTPIEEIWEDDRAVVCLIDTGDMTTGSLENAQR
jgi:hypothetical protein